jgi:hypothetical protein
MRNFSMRTHFGVLGLTELMVGLVIFQMRVNGQDFNLSPSFGGHATALQVTPWEDEPMAFASTGTVPAQGGERENSMRDTPPVSWVAAHLLYAVTLGSGSQNHSQSSLNSLDVKLGSHEVTALWVESEATATVGFLNSRLPEKPPFKA